MSENSKSKVGFLAAFQVAAVWFGAHVGGGFATGNQTMNFFVKHGWHSVWLPAVIVIIIGLTYRESLILAKNYGAYDYKSWSKKMYEPYDKVFSVIFEIGYLMIVLLGTGGSIAGSASLMENYGVNYLVGVLITGGIFYILTIYGSELIRKASTIITVLILIFLTIIVIVGIVNNSGNLSHLISTKYSPSSFGTVLYSGLRYAGYQAFVVVGYGYVGVIGIFAVVIPCIVVGRIKNNKFKKEQQSILRENKDDISSKEDQVDVLKGEQDSVPEGADDTLKEDKESISIEEEKSTDDDASKEDENNISVENQDNI
ncbi:hypothetical protein ACTQ4K_15255 [Clostridium sporogenes]|uniref:hypothetical protein n=1 Tax=Clostridium sporogenes TaxID=1509 RepID=UPI003F934417